MVGLVIASSLFCAVKKHKWVKKMTNFDEKMQKTINIL